MPLSEYSLTCFVCKTPPTQAEQRCAAPVNSMNVNFYYELNDSDSAAHTVNVETGKDKEAHCEKFKFQPKKY